MMLSINEINLLKSQNEGLKTQNIKLQAENKHLQDLYDQALKNYDEFVQKMKTYEEIKEQLEVYKEIKDKSSIFASEFTLASGAIKALQWVLQSRRNNDRQGNN